MMVRTIEFDISIDDINPTEIVIWLVHNPNSGIPDSMEFDGKQFTVYKWDHEPGYLEPFYKIELEIRGAFEAFIRTKGFSDLEFKNIIKKRKLHYSSETDDGYIILNPLWNSIYAGQIKIYSIGNASQIMGESLEYPAIFPVIENRIFSVFHDQYHNNLEKSNTINKDPIVFDNTPLDTESIEQWKPWKHIPVHGEDQRIIELWCREKLTAFEIAERLDYNPRYITNIISKLRKKYPEAKIPFNEERKRKTYYKK